MKAHHLILTFALLLSLAIPSLAQINSRPIPGGIRLSPTTRLTPTVNIRPQGITNPSNDYRDEINQVFANVDPRPITTGLLWDYGLEFTDVQKFNGSPNSNNFITLPEWRFLYGSLTTMQYNNNVSLPELSTVNRRLRQAGAGTTQAIVALHVRYDQFRSDATSRGVSVSGNRLTCGNTHNPYQTKFAFAAALEQSVLEGRTHRFVLRSDLFINRSGKTLDRIDVDPGLGSFRTIQLNQSFSVTYSSEGQKTFKCRVHYTDGTTVESRSPMYVTNLGTSSPATRYAATDTLVRRFEATGNAAGALVTVEYAGTDRVLDKPFIVVEGFDAWRALSPENPRSNFSFEDFITDNGLGEINVVIDNATNLTLNDAIESEGYDLVFIDYENGLDFIERNAEMVENVIRWVNDQKPAGAEPNVVLGMSMGGLVARMALREMETQGEVHQTRLYISHDAPHQGANVPVAAQAAVLHLATTGIGFGVPGISFLTISLADLNADLGNAARLQNEPASRQLQQYYVTLNGFQPAYDFIAHNTFMQNYRTMGLPQQNNIRNVAIASGSECAPGQDFGPYAELFRLPNESFFSFSDIGGIVSAAAAPFTSIAPQLFVGFPLITKTDLRAEMVLNALPNQQSQRVYKGRLFLKKELLFGLVKFDASITDKALNSLATMLPLDSSPGGIYDIGNFGGLPDEVFGVELNFNFERFCYIPTTSALDIKQDGRAITTPDLNARYSPTDPSVDQNFANFFTNPQANENHIQFTPNNGRWMLNEMEETPTTFSCLFACAGTEFALTISGPTEVCGSATFQAANTGGQPIVWRTSGNLSITGGQNTTTLQVRSGSISTDGPGWVEATVGTGDCEVTERFNVTTGTTIPAPGGIEDPVKTGSNRYSIRLINPQPNVTYTWAMEEATITGGQGTAQITVETSLCVELFVTVSYSDGCNSTNTLSATFDNYCTNFIVYPNPTNDFLTVAWEADEANAAAAGFSQTTPEAFAVQLYNPQNAMIAEAEAQNGEVTLDVCDQPLGVYVLHILHQGEVYPHEVLIE